MKAGCNITENSGVVRYSMVMDAGGTEGTSCEGELNSLQHNTGRETTKVLIMISGCSKQKESEKSTYLRLSYCAVLFCTEAHCFRNAHRRSFICGAVTNFTRNP